MTVSIRSSEKIPLRKFESLFRLSIDSRRLPGSSLTPSDLRFSGVSL
jgi:hypothetical protein